MSDRWVGFPGGELTSETTLELAPGIRTRRNAGGHVLIDSPAGTIVDIGPCGFAILALFSQPVRLGDAVEHLERECGTTTEFAPTMNALNMLLEEGAIVVTGGTAPHTSGWADPVEHARMLHDDRRTSDYIAAIAAEVRPDDIVLDIGTGSGVLAVAAARAGARHVYAVEASDIADVAARVFVANGVQERVTLLPGWSRHIELPKRADVLVSEVIGNEPFEEEILETTLDARHRLVKRNARLLPSTLTLFARPLLLPEAELRQRTFGRAAVARWDDLYGIDFTPLLDASGPGPVHTITEGEVVATWPPVGPVAQLVAVDLTSISRPSLEAQADVVVDPPGRVNAIAVTFEATLFERFAHTMDPWRWPASSWGTSVWVLPDEIVVDRDAVLRVTYRRRVSGSADGLTCRVIPSEDHSEGDIQQGCRIGMARNTT
jgi:hypothetical protein